LLASNSQREAIALRLAWTPLCPMFLSVVVLEKSLAWWLVCGCSLFFNSCINVNKLARKAA